jgi:hypothetical protein
MVRLSLNPAHKMGAVEPTPAAGHPDKRRVTPWWLVAAGGALLLCLACAGLTGIGLAGSVQVRARGGPVGLVIGPGLMDVCAGAVTQPRWQIGVGWQSPVMNRTPPAVMFSLQAVCVGFPAWPPPLPMRGEFMFPP